MLYALIFLNLIILERILNINVGFMSIGIGDIFIIFFCYSIFLVKETEY